MSSARLSQWPGGGGGLAGSSAGRPAAVGLQAWRSAGAGGSRAAGKAASIAPRLRSAGPAC